MAVVGYGVTGVGAVGVVVGGVIAGVNYARYADVFFIAPNGDEATRKGGICRSGDGQSYGAPGSCGDGGVDLDPNAVKADIDNGALDEFRSAVKSGIAGGLVVLGAGALVAATGIVLAVGSADGEVADAAVGGEIPSSPAAQSAEIPSSPAPQSAEPATQVP